MSDLYQQLDRVFAELPQVVPRLEVEHDPDWPSPCEIGQPWRDADGQTKVAWQPVIRADGADDFSGLENALEFPIHPDIKAYYGRYWASHVAARAPDGDLSLLFLWNPQDSQRLIENLIGHAVACRNNKTPFAVFFAVTEPDSDYFLTVHNQTGQVQVEKPGYPPIRIIAESLAEFLASVEPC